MNAPALLNIASLAPNRQSLSGLAGMVCPAWVHASAVVLGEHGLLITGAPGSGKTRLARQLIDLAAAQGRFAALAGDDRVRLRVSHGRLLASGHPAIAGRMELRGLGILSCDAIDSVCITAVVALLPQGCDLLPRLPLQESQPIEISGSKIREFGLDVSAAASPAVTGALSALCAMDWRGQILHI